MAMARYGEKTDVFGGSCFIYCILKKRLNSLNTHFRFKTYRMKETVPVISKQ